MAAPKITNRQVFYVPPDYCDYRIITIDRHQCEGYVPVAIRPISMAVQRRLMKRAGKIQRKTNHK